MSPSWMTRSSSEVDLMIFSLINEIIQKYQLEFI
jgi:hypothetical protein